MTFLKTPESEEIAWLDYCGYHLVETQKDLTPVQALYISIARAQLHNKMNSVDEKDTDTPRQMHDNLTNYDPKYGKFQR